MRAAREGAFFAFILGCLIAPLTLTAHAQVVDCLDVVSTEATGYGVAGAAEEEQFEQALSGALASAVIQVRGVYIDSKQELIDIFRETVTDGVAQRTSSTEFRDEVTQRFSGLILRYEVLDHAIQEGGVVATRIEADICLDERIALDVRGPATALSTFSGLLASTIANTGWSVTSTPEVSGTDRSSFVVGLESGAAYVARGQLQTQRGNERGSAVSYGATLDVALIDVRTLEIVDNLTASENGVGFTDAEAEQDAVQKLANVVSKHWSQRFLAPQERQASTLIVSNVMRSNSRYTLEDIVVTLPGVLEVTSVRYDESARAVLLELELTSDLCGVADALSLERRIVMEVAGCDGSRAEVVALRE